MKGWVNQLNNGRKQAEWHKKSPAKMFNFSKGFSFFLLPFSYFYFTSLASSMMIS